MTMSRGKRKKQLPGTVLCLLALVASGTRTAGAIEVECDSLRLRIALEAYDTTCEADSNAAVTVQVLEANAMDGSHFLIVVDRTTDARHLFPAGTSLREELDDTFTELEVSGWHTGQMQQGLRTGEFNSEYKTVPSACLGFQGHGSPTAGGWRRAIVGFGCTRSGDREQLYQALRHINFPE